MSDQATADWVDRSDAERQEPGEPAGVATVEAYEVEDGVVLYDAENPLGWLESTDAVALPDAA